MNNTIDSLVDGTLPRLNGQRTDSAGKGAGSPQATQDVGPSSDLLDLTGQAQTLKALEQDLAKTPEFDAAKVAELRDAIAGGSYKIDSQSIAEKLLDLESKLP